MLIILKIVFLLLVVGMNSLLGIFVYKNNPRSATNRIFTALSFVTSLWLFTMHISSQGINAYNGLLWIRLSIFFAVPQATLFYFLARTLPSERLQIKEGLLLIIVFVAIFIMGLTLSPFVFREAIIRNGTLEPVVGPAIPLFSSYVVLFSVLAVVTLLKKLKHASGIEKQQLRYVFYGIIAMLALIILTILIPVVIFNVNTFVDFAPLYTLIFLSATAYAILKHQLLDIRALVARSVAFSFLVVFIGFIFAGGVNFVGQFLFGYSISSVNLIITTIFTLLIAYSYQSLLRHIEMVTDRIFYKNRYDSRFLLARLSRIMASTLELEELTELILRAIISDVKIAHGVIFLTKNRSVEWSKSIVQHGRSTQDMDSHTVNQLIDHLEKRGGQKIIIYDEIKNEKIKELCKKKAFSLVFPLIVNHKTIGIIALGEKSSGDVYASEDIRLFQILAPEIAIAVKNSLQYEEIRRFNITLREEIKIATNDLRDANAKLKELDQMKDDFVSVASHELRTPMTAIKSYLWLALDGRGGKLSQKQKYYLDRAYISTDRLIKLVNDMLNISRIESGRITIEMAKVDIQQIAQDVLDEVKPRADEVKVNVLIDQPRVKILPVLADPDKIKEVFFNIIGNSLKFTPEKGSITISFEPKEGSHVVVHVHDTGRGIEEKDMGTLFTKFGMVEGSYVTNKKASGTGLGLYICKSIIELHKGKIWAESPGLDKGTTFSFTLPYYKKGDKVVIKPEKSVEDRKLGIIHTGV